MSLSARVAGLSILATTLLLAGCGDKKEGEGEAKSETQVAARVNSDEITVHQVNAAMQRLNAKVPQDKVQQASNAVLKGLVDQQLLVQKAIEDKLDRDPNIMQAIEAARTQILAQGYLQRKAQGAAKPTESEISDYIGKHPELFAERRAYRLQELVIQGAADKAEQIRAQLAASKNLEEFAQWLKSQNIAFRGSQAERAAEQLPAQLATQLMKTKPGQAIIANNNGVLTVILVVAAVNQPVPAEQAKPLAERILTAQKQRELAENEIKALRAAAKIEYLGAFADAGKEPAQATAPAPAQPAATDAAKPADANSEAMQKGLSGL
ncbi:MAG: peptidyl-prolyl cis-trans isomerase, EpsD family [Hydrogenophilaceae bacterium]|nr:peptidyl-prolyl cis-trans isomerase, EpsD family [Hydrogenophilaceae bacterium]